MICPLNLVPVAKLDYCKSKQLEDTELSLSGLVGNSEYRLSVKVC